jgi:hypothetical protein
MSQPGTEYIVAEITKNWSDGQPVTPGTVSQEFERIIELNRRRGYTLYKFSLAVTPLRGGMLTETIIAVFRDDSFAERN